MPGEARGGGVAVSRQQIDDDVFIGGKLTNMQVLQLSVVPSAGPIIQAPGGVVSSRSPKSCCGACQRANDTCISGT